MIATFSLIVRPAELPHYTCDVCGAHNARLMRGKRVSVPLCDGCALEKTVLHPITHLELRIIAVATEAFFIPSEG